MCRFAMFLTVLEHFSFAHFGDFPFDFGPRFIRLGVNIESQANANVSLSRSLGVSLEAKC
jgi:hypothetical protein